MARRSTASDGPDTAGHADSAKPNAVRTRLLIISDTHASAGAANTGLGIEATVDADVAIHCGDLTQESKLVEFQIAIDLLRSINAPLKLVIAGNHDFTLDLPVFQNKIEEACRLQGVERQLIGRHYGEYGEARQLFDKAKDAGIVFLDEGNYDFRLNNDALLKVYASPFTPSVGDWGFQYAPQQGHHFSIEDGTHLVMTHGPPLGICDYIRDSGAARRAGCGSLFAAIARARPLLHCFGHIHEGWGARYVTWRDKPSQNPSHFTDIENRESVVIENLSTIRDPARNRTTSKYDVCVSTKHGSRNSLPLRLGRQTLFVNAAIEDVSPSQSPHLPWLVELELPRYTTEHTSATNLAPDPQGHDDSGTTT
ncbi:Metallo-dependent phosphatase-like protein [Xylaria telfairii]|nr:Metallo-dependent phosphatase-like protein [Xylaria telfairii]